MTPVHSDRRALFARLDDAAQTLGVSPQRLLSLHSRQVGVFPDSRPLPRVVELSDLELATLVGMAEQSVRLAQARASAPRGGVA